MTKPSSPSPIIPATGTQAVKALVKTAGDASGGLITTLSTPKLISITFPSTPGVNPYLARIDTICPSDGQTEALSTAVKNNGDGTHTASALVEPPFAVRRLRPGGDDKASPRVFADSFEHSYG
ncbi:MAG TPA: hypothetical protein VMW65_17850 [Chloroflexota bacterium]|nr:hypothetical protein [Chloroflexota bacterium]